LKLPRAFLALASAAACGCGPFSLDAVSIDPSSLTHDLIAHWAFDQTGGPAVTDSSGDGRDGILTGGTWLTDGAIGGALRLAAGDHVTVAGFPPATTGWTVSVWTRATALDLATDASNDFAPIISAEMQFAGGWQINLDNRGMGQRFLAAYWARGAANQYVRVFCSCVEPDQWIHLTAVWDGERAMVSLYRDGQKVGEEHMPSPISAGDMTLYLGAWYQPGRFFAGDIDDFAIWQRALQPVEIALLSHGVPSS
jgi:hypothetical protein